MLKANKLLSSQSLKLAFKDTFLKLNPLVQLRAFTSFTGR